MNKVRRQRIKEAIDLIQQVNEILAEVGDEEEEAFDNMPESLQESERGEQMQEYIDMIDEANEAIDDLIGNLSEITEG